MTTLREARDQGKLEQFIAEHEKDAPGDRKAMFPALISTFLPLPKA